jgi:hypothetical protein
MTAVKSELSQTPDFRSLAKLIQERRARVAHLVNTTSTGNLGKRSTTASTRTDGVGGTVNELAGFLSTNSPGLRGFSASNLWRMRQFYETWKDAPEKLATLLRDLPWSAHLDILGRCKSTEEKQFYLAFAVREQKEVYRQCDL